MKIRAYIIPLLVAVGCTMIALSSAVPTFAASQDFDVQPHRLRITESFHGRTLHISAQIPVGTQAIVELKGEPLEEDLLRKGRRYELWMSVGEIKVEGAPSLYLAITTDPKLLSKQDPDDRWGYGALREDVKFSGTLPKPGEAPLFPEFLKLKESEGLYGEFPGALKLVATDDKMQTIQGRLRLPGNIRPGKYELVLTVLKDGRIVEHKSIEFDVVMKQLTELLYSLAQNHPTLYGFVAVAIAMVMGLLTGLVFKGKGAH